MRSPCIPALPCCCGADAAHINVLQISSRKVMQQVLLQNGVPPEAFSPVCVIVDKVDKIGKEKVGSELAPYAVLHAITRFCKACAS